MKTSAFRSYIAGFVGDRFDVITTGVETFLATSGGFGPVDPQLGQAFGLVEVVYEYSVPEPGTIFLLGLVMSAMLVKRL